MLLKVAIVLWEGFADLFLGGVLAGGEKGTQCEMRSQCSYFIPYCFLH